METLTDLIAYAAELSLDKLGRSCGMRRVIETDMQALAYLPRKRRTDLVGSPAHGNDVIPRLIQIGTDTDRSMAADVDPASFITSTALGLTCAAGSVPPEYTSSEASNDCRKP